MHEAVKKILEVFEIRGSERYGDESVTQLQHALQCASLAANESASTELVAAALLHDIGHLLSSGDLPAGCNSDLDDQHETIGYAFLKQHFCDAVAEPVRLHVVAKRYLCTTYPEYQEQLSVTSYKSYLDQGGVMSVEELRAFEQEPYLDDAVRLRHWDDKGKDLSAALPALGEFIPQLERALTDATNA